MPSDTEGADVTSARAPSGATGPGEPGRPAARRERGPVWPVTALVVLLGWCLLAWTVFAAAINTAPFFGETASRDRYLESGMVSLTALVPVLLLVVLGLLLGSRWGLALLAVPALLLVPLGLSSLGQAGDPAKSGYGRALRLDDAVQDLTRLNWVAAVVLLLVIAAVVTWRRRRQTGIRAEP
ncbi:hypothetical protein SAMN04489867_3542 [Pedococcus dokdonensis]|uniref:Uncharacterized protein n=1 Tax=Pedococcus dokdonensis TaxID=443156 RepID=A0A1H0UWM5_9MICO|nr:hypothetical protein [Pedococcus dokdonensis]SDP70533.1 hypothetical protein SAMN04489867_3542 [Pedococcus dokdonensis]